MSDIHGYTLRGELTNKNSGFSMWGFCTRAGREFFIKQFTQPVYPLDNPAIDPKRLASRRQKADAFFRDKTEYYKRLNNCKSGNIIWVQEFFREGSKYYIVTEKVNAEGSDPSIVAKENNEKKRVLLSSLLYSFGLFHNAGLVHADVKPDNILLKRTRAGYFTAKIIDFDAGFMVGHMPEDPDEIHGDYVYLAPETLRRMKGEDVILNEKIDIFALGILFHQYWTGKLPEIDKDCNSVAEAVLKGKDIRLSDDIPPNLRTMLGLMLSPDPKARPSATEVHKLLNPTVENEDAKPKSEPLPEPKPEEKSAPYPPPKVPPKWFAPPDDLD